MDRKQTALLIKSIVRNIHNVASEIEALLPEDIERHKVQRFTGSVMTHGIILDRGKHIKDHPDLYVEEDGDIIALEPIADLCSELLSDAYDLGDTP